MVYSFSLPKLPVNFIFFADAADVYGASGLAPATEASAGLDLRACLPEGQGIIIEAGQRQMIHTGIGIEIILPHVAGFVYSRSGLGALKGLTVAQGVGVIDADYRGEITVPLLNTSGQAYEIKRGERIAQLVFQPYFSPSFTQVQKLGDTERGKGGFGHTGSV